eukprot:15470030-Alexandrium_andersonii.AAC.1
MVFTKWLVRRHPRLRIARHLFRILHYLECRYNFVTVGHCFRTYHNLTADFGTRVEKEVAEARMRELQLDPLDGSAEWAHL